MKFRTFYRLFYRHRFSKASKILKIYLIFILPIKYFMNFFYFEKKVNLDKYESKNKDLFNKNLNTLFEHFNSDKGEYFINQYMQPIKKNLDKIKAHGYANIYEKIFLKHKEKDIDILELGSFYGNASAALYFYFKKAKIHSGDINPDMFKFFSNRIRNFYVDTGSEISITKNILEYGANFDFIIEDASHMLKDQIISLFMLFPLIKPGGYFIIEELDFPETREDMRIGEVSLDLKQILNNIKNNKEFNSEYINENDKKYFLNNFSLIEILKGNFNEIAIIKKNENILHNS